MILSMHILLNYRRIRKDLSYTYIDSSDNGRCYVIFCVKSQGEVWCFEREVGN